MSNEVATGYGHLNGYELYDLVAVNQSETGVVVQVGGEKLKVNDDEGFRMKRGYVNKLLIK